MATRPPLVLVSGELQRIQSADTLDPATLATGTRDGTKFLRDDGAFAIPTEPSRYEFRLSLVSGSATYADVQSLTPSSTDTSAMTVTFAAAHGWNTGQVLYPNAAGDGGALGGLTANTPYYARVVTSTSISFYTTAANAIANTSKVTLTGTVSAVLYSYGIAGATLYLTPYIGTGIGTYDSSAWVMHNSAEVSLALSGLTSGKNYDVFATWTGSAIAPELSAAWTSDTVRADALAQQDGVTVKSADHSRRWVGTIRATSATTTEDSQLQPFVSNAFNQVHKVLSSGFVSASHSYTTNAWREWNGGTGSIRLKALMANPGVIQVQQTNDRAGGGVFSTGFDSTTIAADFFFPVAAGYHFVAPIEFGVTGATFSDYWLHGLIQC